LSSVLRNVVKDGGVTWRTGLIVIVILCIALLMKPVKR
jgi:hypothetical protein